MFNYKVQGQSSAAQAIAGLIIIGLIVLMSCGSQGVVTATTKHGETVTILNADVVRTGESNIYLIDAELLDGTTEVFAIKDNWAAGMWNSRDIYFSLKNRIGDKVVIEVVGWRVPFLSWHREIIEVYQ